MSKLSKQVYVELHNRSDFHEILKVNPGIIILKLGATWCKPCQLIKSLVNSLFLQTSDNVLCFDLDVDDMFDIYSYLKKNKMVNGIPAILVWKKGNTSLAPDYSVTGSDTVKINNLFKNNINV